MKSRPLIAALTLALLCLASAANAQSAKVYRVGFLAKENYAPGSAARNFMDTLVRELLACHYDPMYARSMAKNFPNVANAIVVSPYAITEHAFADVVRELEVAVNARQRARTPVAA